MLASALVASAGPARAAIDDQFRAWLSADLWPEARARGISKASFDAAFAGVRPNLKLPDLVLPGEKPATPKLQHQAEFRAPGDYFAEKTIGAVAAGGRGRASLYARTLAAAERRTGVPASIVLAVWGRESGFGAAKGSYDAFEVLGTKAFLATRKETYRTELLAALDIVEKGLAKPRALKSSWAGAMGQPQFLPTSFLRYAVDGDGDGSRDIWNSAPDSLASIANYLKAYGWVADRPWGYEAAVPASLSCSLEGPDRGRPISDWAKLGIARFGGAAFPADEASREGFLLMPAGRSGPAFIVTPNFYVLKEYNQSDLYALFIGHAADRIDGAGAAFAAPWRKVDALDRSEVAGLQRALQAKGYDVGGADGLPGYKTRRSIGAWQEETGQPATCFPDAALVKALR